MICAKEHLTTFPNGQKLEVPDNFFIFRNHFVITNVTWHKLLACEDGLHALSHTYYIYACVQLCKRKRCKQVCKGMQGWPCQKSTDTLPVHPTPSMHGFWHGHPYIPAHFCKNVFLYLIGSTVPYKHLSIMHVQQLHL